MHHLSRILLRFAEQVFAVAPGLPPDCRRLGGLPLLERLSTTVPQDSHCDFWDKQGYENGIKP